MNYQEVSDVKEEFTDAPWASARRSMAKRSEINTVAGPSIAMARIPPAVLARSQDASGDSQATVLEYEFSPCSATR